MSILFRIAADIVIFISIFTTPWWFSVLLICIVIFWFEFFYESLLFSFFLDGFHGIPGMTFFGINTFFTTVIGVVFLVSIFLKTRLKFY